MNKKIIIILLVLLLSVGVVFAFKAKKKIGDAQKLEPSVKNFNLNLHSFTDVLSSMWNGFDVNIDIAIKNHTKSDFTVTALQADIYTLDNTLLAKQQNIITENIDIAPKSETIIKMKYHLPASGLLKLAKQIDIDTFDKLKDLLFNYLTTETIGTQLKLKGSITAEGFSVDLNEKIDI